MRKIILFLTILLLPTLVYARNYGTDPYGSGFYGVGEVTENETGPGGGGVSKPAPAETPEIIPEEVPEIIYECSQDSDCSKEQYCFEHKCYDAECFDDDDCKEDESCWNYRCVKWFDVEILEFESPVKIGEFFDFTYLLKAMAEINGDVEIEFWIEQDGNVVTSGQDTIYFGGFEEKTKTKKLFLPADISSGTYIFYIEVTYGTYTAGAHRTIGIEVKDGVATITMIPLGTPYGLIVLAVLILFFIFYFKRDQIRNSMIEWGRRIKEYKVSILIFLLFIILGILAYYLKLYELIANLIPKVNILSYSSGYYILGGILVLIFIIGLIVLIKKRSGIYKLLR